MLRELLVALNSLILPLFYTNIKQTIIQHQQYGIDLQKMLGDSLNTACIKTGQEYQSSRKLLFYLILVLIIIISQFCYIQYIINNSFYPYKNFLLLMGSLCVILASLLPLLLILCYIYDVKYIGYILLNINYLDPVTDFLKINITSIITWLSGLYIASNIMYLLIFNNIHYICISKAT